MSNYIAIIYPPPPATHDQAKTFYQTGSVQIGRQPQVKLVEADRPELAAKRVDVPAGGYVLVAAESAFKRYNRPKVASLQESLPNGEPFAEPGPADA